MRYLLPLLTLLCLACAPTGLGFGDQGDFTTERRSYSPGEDLRLRLYNDSGYTLAYDLCRVVLEREVGGVWAPADRQARRSCSEAMHPLAPGGEARGVYPIPERLRSGRYRLSTEVALKTGQRYPRRTNTFLIEAEL